MPVHSNGVYSSVLFYMHIIIVKGYTFFITHKLCKVENWLRTYRVFKFEVQELPLIWRVRDIVVQHGFAMTHHTQQTHDEHSHDANSTPVSHDLVKDGSFLKQF